MELPALQSAEETSVKPLTRIDFGPAIAAGLIDEHERTLENWIRLHLSTNPAVITPGDPEGHLSADPKNPQPVAPTAMPYFGFNKEETEALVSYVTSLKTEKIPYSYRVNSIKEPEVSPERSHLPTSLPAATRPTAYTPSP